MYMIVHIFLGHFSHHDNYTNLGQTTEQQQQREASKNSSIKQKQQQRNQCRFSIYHPGPFTIFLFSDDTVPSSNIYTRPLRQRRLFMNSSGKENRQKNSSIEQKQQIAEPLPLSYLPPRFILVLCYRPDDTVTVANIYTIPRVKDDDLRVWSLFSLLGSSLVFFRKKDTIVTAIIEIHKRATKTRRFLCLPSSGCFGIELQARAPKCVCKPQH